MLQLSLTPIATGEMKKAQIAQSLFEQTEKYDDAQRYRVLTQIKRACEVAMTEIPVLTDSEGNTLFVSDLALRHVLALLAEEGRDKGKILIDGAPYTVNVKEIFDMNADKNKAADEPKLIAHPRHESVKKWHQYDDLQAELKAQSATCTRKKADAVKDYREAYPDAEPTSIEITLSIGD